MLVRRRTLGFIWPGDPEWIWPWDSQETVALKMRLRQVKSVLPLTPPAPQTEAKMKTWTPADIFEATAQRRQVAIEDAAGGSGAGAGDGTPQAQSFPWWIVICAALGAGAIGIRLATRRK